MINATITLFICAVPQSGRVIEMSASPPSTSSLPRSSDLSGTLISLSLHSPPESKFPISEPLYQVKLLSALRTGNHSSPLPFPS